MSDTARDMNQNTLFRRLHQVSRTIFAASDETAVGQALMDFAATGGCHAARLLIFADMVDGRPTAVEMREGWTVDDRPAQPYGTRLSLAEFPLLEYLDADATIICENVATDERLNEPVRRLMSVSGLGSFAVIPMTTHQRDADESDQVWLGAVFIGCDTPSVYEEELIYAWWTLTGQAATALESARVYGDTRQRLKDLRLLFDASAAISSALDLDTILNDTIRQITRVLATDGCAISTWDRDQEALVTRVDHSTNHDWSEPEPPGTVYPLADYPASRRVLTSRQPLTIQVNDPDADPSEVAWMKKDKVKSLLMVPMIVRDEAVGLLEIMLGSEEREFTSTEIALCQTLANQAAGAIENARMFEQAQIALAETEALYQTNLAIGAATSREQVGQAVVDYVAAHPVDAVRILWLEYERDEPVDLRFGPAWRRDRPTITADVNIPLSDYPLASYMDPTQPIIVTDVLTDTQSDEAIRQLLIDQLDLRAFALTPIVKQDRWFGYLFVGRVRPGSFSEEAMRDYMTLAAQAAIALENQQLYAQEQQRRQQAEAVTRVGRLLASTLDLQSVLHEVMEQTAQVMNVPQCGAIILDEKAGVGHLLAQYPSEADETSAPVEIPIAGNLSLQKIVETRLPLAIPDAETDPLTASIRDVVRQRRIKSILIVPMLVGGKLIGTLGFDSIDAIRHFTDDEITVAMTLADQLAAKIENSRLLEQTQALARREQQLREISTRLRVPVGVDGVMRALAQELGQALGRRAFVRLGSDEPINPEPEDQGSNRSNGGGL